MASLYFIIFMLIYFLFQVIQFWMEDKYTATLYHNNTQKGPVFIVSVLRFKMA